MISIFRHKKKTTRKLGGLFSGEWNCYLNKGKIAFAKPVSAAKIALTIVATIALPPSHISTITKLTINILNQNIKFNVKWVKIYTLNFHEENNKVAITIDSFMRKIAYNEFIILYIFLIFCKLRYLYLRNLIIIEKPFSIFPVQTELKNIREGFLIYRLQNKQCIWLTHSM